MRYSYFTHLECSRCHATVDGSSLRTLCPTCGGILTARYDMAAVRGSLRKGDLAGRINSMWKYHELLAAPDEASLVTLGEGWTPLLAPAGLRSRMKAPGLRIKEEGANPTGSFKARGLSAAVTGAKLHGVTEGCMPSAGNAGGALAAYGAAAGIKTHVFVPEETPSVNKREVGLFGGRLYEVPGVISDAARAMNQMKKPGWFDFSTMKEPYRLEGKKTMAYELAEQSDWKLPRVVIYPAGGGTGLVGMWKAFGEMEELGWTSGPKPKMVAVQMEGCAPVVRAVREGASRVTFWENATTVAAGLRVPGPFADELILATIRESGGTAVAVTDADAIASVRAAARADGLFLSPEGGAALSAVTQLLASGFMEPADDTVVFNTGSGYKYIDFLPGLS